MLTIREAKDEDRTRISVLVDTTFDETNEVRMIEALRASGHAALELVAEMDDHIIGHILFSRFDAPEGWWVLAPVCVSNSYQARGVGSELIRYGLDRARQTKAKAVVVLGNPLYYRRFGFVFEGPAKLQTPYPVQYTGLYPIDSAAATAQVALRYPGAFENV